VSRAPANRLRMYAYSDRINHAFAFAAKHHRGPGSASPGSLGHPANVAVILARYACDQPTLVAGILHHVLEDATPDRRELLEHKVADKFGPVVLAIAADASEPRYTSRGEERPWRACKHDFLAHLAVADPRALDIIAADEIHRCGSTIAALRRLGAEYLRAVSQASSEETIWWYRSLTEVLASRPDWPQRAMLEELRALAADLVRGLREREEEL
jgi:(p)ppGpp synthase/HD superfamily hydrolase